MIASEPGGDEFNDMSNVTVCIIRLVLESIARDPTLTYHSGGSAFFLV
jgi:hypothetical protein